MCNTCCTGAYDSGSSCGNCPNWCMSCSSLTSCSYCAAGYEPSGGSCRNSTGLQVGCFSVVTGNNGNGVGGLKCNVAGNGYYVDGSSNSRPCSNAVSNCMECTENASPICSACRTGYYLSTSMNMCVSCAAALNGCLACINSLNCMNCPIAYKKTGVGSNNNCSACFPTCQTCLTFYDQCSKCYPAQNRDLNGTQCLCKDGYYDISPTGNYTCPPCSSALSYCYLCTNTTICIQCMTNYYKATISGKVQCEPCSPYCETCNTSSTNCTACNGGTYNRVLNGSTCSCMASFVSVGGSVSCLPCSKLN